MDKELLAHLRRFSVHQNMEECISVFKAISWKSAERKLTENECDELLDIAYLSRQYADANGLSTQDMNDIVADVLRRITH